jgi:hypothetical protein
MKLSTRAKAGMAAAAFVVVGGIFVLRVLSFRTNENALESSLSVMGAEDRDRVQRLVKRETAGMTQNEENGIVYYHSEARTDKRNYVYLLWLMAGPNSRTYSIVESALSKEKLGAAKTVGVAVYVDFGFYSFRSKYEMMLARAFRDMGFGALRAACYRWDDKLGSWAYVTELSNDVVIALLTPDQKRAILGGTYNIVSAAELKEVK